MEQIVIVFSGDEIETVTITLSNFPLDEAQRAAERLMEIPLKDMCGVMWKTPDWSREAKPGTSVLRIFFLKGALLRFRARYGMPLEEFLQKHYLGGD